MTGMLVDTIVASVAIGKLRGGSLTSLGNMKVRGLELILSAFLVELALRFASQRLAWLSGVLGSCIYLATYVMLLTAVWLNRDKPGFPILGAGVAMNFAACLANGGRMPVDLDRLRALGMGQSADAIAAGSVAAYGAVGPATRLRWLADVIPIGRPYPIHRIVSAGDVVMAVGVFVLVQAEMLRERREGGRGARAGSRVARLFKG